MSEASRTLTAPDPVGAIDQSRRDAEICRRVDDLLAFIDDWDHGRIDGPEGPGDDIEAGYVDRHASEIRAICAIRAGFSGIGHKGRLWALQEGLTTYQEWITRSILENVAVLGSELAGAGLRGSAPRNPDVELLEIVRKAFDIRDQQTVLNHKADQHPSRSAERDAFWTQIYALTTEYLGLPVEAADLPARTFAGLQAKARLVIEQTGDGDSRPDDHEDGLIAWSLARDLLMGAPA